MPRRSARLLGPGLFFCRTFGPAFRVNLGREGKTTHGFRSDSPPKFHVVSYMEPQSRAVLHGFDKALPSGPHIVRLSPPTFSSQLLALPCGVLHARVPAGLPHVTPRGARLVTWPRAVLSPPALSHPVCTGLCCRPLHARPRHPVPAAGERQVVLTAGQTHAPPNSRAHAHTRRPATHCLNRCRGAWLQGGGRRAEVRVGWMLLSHEDGPSAFTKCCPAEPRCPAARRPSR